MLSKSDARLRYPNMRGCRTQLELLDVESQFHPLIDDYRVSCDGKQRMGKCPLRIAHRRQTTPSAAADQKYRQALHVATT